MRVLVSALDLFAEAPPIAEANATVFRLEDLYGTHRSHLIGVLIRFGVNGTDAEDIAQEVFLRGLSISQKGSVIVNCFSWLCVSAKHLAIALHHRAQRERLSTPQYWELCEATLPDPSPDSLQLMINAQRRDRMMRALAQLSYREQQCILLRGRGETFQEIADSLNISMRKAMYASENALIKLQTNLQSNAS